MTLPRRDSLHHTYADYLTWSRSSGDELIAICQSSTAWSVLNEPLTTVSYTLSENYGGPLLTASGLLFIGATIYDHKLGVFDSKSA
jgi:hypothetical protein